MLPLRRNRKDHLQNRIIILLPPPLHRILHCPMDQDLVVEVLVLLSSLVFFFRLRLESDWAVAAEAVSAEAVSA